MSITSSTHTPPWLKKRLVVTEDVFETKSILKEYAVRTVCEESLCPNLTECFSQRKATFLILGEACTRSCGFCSVKRSTPDEVDSSEPGRIVEAVKKLNLKYIIITSVTRDDLPDGGASQFVKTIQALRDFSKAVKIEVLVPDFDGKVSSIEKVARAKPDIFGHNIETVERLYSIVRPIADYSRSLDIFRLVKRLDPLQLTKSGVMVGLGETEREVMGTMRDLKSAGCDILTIGQYLRPGTGNLPVDRFVAPEEFEEYEKYGKSIGFKYTYTGPFVRSSYSAEAILTGGVL